MFAALDDLADALGRLDAALDSGDDTDLAVAARRLAALHTRFEAVWLRTIARAEQRGLPRRDGARDTAAWVAELAGQRRGASRRDAELAAHLAASPVLADAMACGEVSKAKAAELVRAVDLPEDTQHALLDQARTAPVEEVAAAVQHARLAHGLPSPAVAPSLTIRRHADHAAVEATLDLLDAEFLDVALSTAVEALDLPTTMPYAERRARALGAVARFFLDHQHQVPTGRVGRPHVIVLVDFDVLQARAGGTATFTSGTVITGDAARRLAEDANLSRVITAGRSEPLDVGRSTRTIPPALAKAVIAHDRHCRYHGCTLPPWACDIHHLQPWSQGGTTALANLALLCWHHHDHVHRHDPANLTTTPDGTWRIQPVAA